MNEFSEKYFVVSPAATGSRFFPKDDAQLSAKVFAALIVVLMGAILSISSVPLG
jgi:hypothetical protein